MYYVEIPVITVDDAQDVTRCRTPHLYIEVICFVFVPVLWDLLPLPL